MNPGYFEKNQITEKNIKKCLLVFNSPTSKITKVPVILLKVKENKFLTKFKMKYLSSVLLQVKFDFTDEVVKVSKSFFLLIIIILVQTTFLAVKVSKKSIQSSSNHHVGIPLTYSLRIVESIL